MKKFLKSISLVLMLSLLLSCVSLASADGVIEVTLPTYKTGENVGAVFFEPLVERFNAAYEGKYHITLEELTQDMYTDKIKQLGAANALPFLIEGGDSEWIKQVVIPNDMFVDLSGLIAENNLMDILIDSQVAYNTTADGKVFSICVPVTRPMGLYYNGAMLDLGGKTCAELSWDDVAALLGDNKIAFMTGENAWTTQLVLGSLIAVEEGGACLYIATADNADSLEWHFVSPDGSRDLDYAQAANEFPTLEIINGYASTMQLKSIPAALNGWKVYCRFSNNSMGY